MTDEKIYTVKLTSHEMELILSSLAYQQTRQIYMANLARSLGRTAEDRLRRQCAVEAERLGEKLIRGAR